MTPTDHHATTNERIRREIAGTLGLLADAADFTAMRRYRSFTFDDHHTYLRHTEAVLRALDARGQHTSIALFDPEHYASYCARTGIDPDTRASRTRFTAELAATGPTVPYDGRPLAELLPDLLDETARQATWEYATHLLARAGECATCGEDIGRAAFARASDLLLRILRSARPGAHHLVGSVTTPAENLLGVFRARSDATGLTEADEAAAVELATVLATGFATRSPGGLVMRTTTPGHDDRVQGWRLVDDGLAPLTAAQVFDAYCTDAVSGEPVSPESGVDYCAPPDIDGIGPGASGHTHH
ncbi:hypothetical protein ACFWIA_05850 [Streptomyces sp. NPDC127068]|uniref:hypothetical protein n=1 Tax=Streptomyces sp. NPDC127068 TaxID=3347127 RepID=UPI0036536F7A